jgi:hypothetical protein
MATIGFRYINFISCRLHLSSLMPVFVTIDEIQFVLFGCYRPWNDFGMTRALGIGYDAHTKIV